MKVAILGGGLSGLSAAYNLANDYDVIILEKENYLGGLASSYKIRWDNNSYNISKTYHHILEGDNATIKYLRLLKLESKLKRKKVKQGFVYQGKVFPFSAPLEILKFPLPFYEKFRLGLFTLFKLKNVDLNKLSGISAKDWLIKNVGKRNYYMFFERLIYNKFQDDPKNISAAWFVTRFFKESASFLKKFGWIREGLSIFIDRFEKILLKKGVDIKTNVKITEIITGKSKCKIVYSSKEGKRIDMKVDKIVSTIPPQELLRIAKGLSKYSISIMKKVKYLSCICLAIGTSTDYRACYWNNILDKGYPFSVIFKHSELYEDSCPEGKAVFYVTRYLKQRHNLWRKNNREIVSIFLKYMDKIFPNFSRNIDWIKIFRAKYAEPIYTLDYKNPPIKDGNIYFAGIYRIFPKIRNMASALESGEEVAKKIKEEFS